MQIPIGSPTVENAAVCSNMSAIAVPMSVDVDMPVLVHAYAPIASPGYPLGVDPPRPTSSNVDFQLLSGIDVKMQNAFDDASRRSANAAEMHDRTCNLLRDVEGKMLQRESHFRSEVQAQNAELQEVMQTQATRQWEALEGRQVQMQKNDANTDYSAAKRSSVNGT